jgi:heterodisulfide reductase subunit A
MYTIKNAMLSSGSTPEIDITIFRIDIRTPGKTYEEFYERARQAGIISSRAAPPKSVRTR